MISYSNCIGIKLIDSLLKESSRLFCSYPSVLRELSYTSKHPDSPRLIKKILKKCINSQKFSKVIYEIFVNKSMTKDQLADILDTFFFEDDMLKSKINQILNYKNPEDGSTIIIAASKCEQEGRIEILMKLLESYSDTELFNDCLLATDDKGKSALLYLLRNKHQEKYFSTLFDKVESYRANHREETDRIRDLNQISIYTNIFHKTLISNYEDDMSDEKHKALEKMFKVFSRVEQKKLILTADGHSDTLLVKVIKKLFELSQRVLNFIIVALFENENLYHKVLRKLKRFSGYKGKFLVNAEVFSSAFDYYKLKGKEVIDHLQSLFEFSKSTYSHNLSIGNFQYFRQDRVIRHLITEIDGDSDENDKNLMMTLIFMLNCDDYIQLLENVREEIQCYNQSKKSTLFSLIKSMKMNIEELEVFFERDEFNSYESTFCLHLRENSYKFLYEFLDFIESLCINKTEFCKFLALQLSQLLRNDYGNNIFHRILYKSEKDSHSTMYFDIYETLKIKLGDSKLLNDLQRQTNDSGETPIMLALKYTSIEKCLKFFSENLVETSMRDLLQEVNEISHLIFINLLLTYDLIYNDFESIKKTLRNYFEDSEIDEMFKKASTKRYKGDQNFIHVLFKLKCHPKLNSQSVSIKYLSLLLDEMKKRFGIDYLTELLLQEDEKNRNLLEVIDHRKSIMPYLELIEKHFDRVTIRTLLSKNEGTHKWILYEALNYKSEEDKLFTVQFYKKYFTIDFENMLRKVFETSDYYGNKLIEVKDRDWNDSCKFISYFQIISDNIHNIEFIKTIFSQVNKYGHDILAFDNYKDIKNYVYVFKLAELYFSCAVVKIIFKIEKATQLLSLFIDANDNERYEMMELLERYHPGDWTTLFFNGQVQSLKKISGEFYEYYQTFISCNQKVKIIDIESVEYGYAFYEFLRILVEKLSNFKRSIEQENNFQGYAIVIHKIKERRQHILCLQAVFSIPRENLTSSRINELRIEWEYDNKEDKFTNLSSSNENQEFTFDMIFKTCIVVKSDDEQVKVLVPMRKKSLFPNKFLNCSR